MNRLRDWVGRGSRRREEGGSLLVLIDFYDHRRGGHFGSWLYWFATEFSKRFDRVLVLTPAPEMTATLFGEEGDRRPPNVSFGRLLADSGKRFHLNRTLRGVGRKTEKAAVFFMWGYDLLERRLKRRPRYRWATLIGVSWLLRGNGHEVAKREERLLGIVEEDKSCRAFFQPDFYLRNRHEKSVWITDLEVIATCDEETPLISSIREFGAGTLCVGVFGMLHGYRCVNEILLLAREQPKVRFVLAGKIFRDGIRADLLEDLEGNPRNNLFVYPRFIASERELNSAIGSVDGVFIDGGHYPVQSGIVCRGLHFGKWILCSAGNSWTSDVIAEGGTGFTYTARDSDLIGIWEEWKASGGEDRSRAVSKRLRDPATVARCFDEMSARLLSAEVLDTTHRF